MPEGAGALAVGAAGVRGPVLGPRLPAGRPPAPDPATAKERRHKAKKPAPVKGRASVKVCSGGVLLSREASLAVPSALKLLTSGFGMGPGVSP